jgi:hypothetical protein
MSTQSGSSIDWIAGAVNNMYLANPPASTTEQKLRLQYVQHVFDTVYTASKYQNQAQIYNTYLYVSHFIDNPQYSYSEGNGVYHSSFNSYHTELISAGDKSAYNAFVDYQTNAYLFDSIGTAVESYSAVKAYCNREGISFTDFTDELVGESAELVNYLEDLVTTLQDQLDLTESAAYELIGKCMDTLAKDFRNIPVDEMSDALYEQIEDYADTASPILITNLSGTIFEAFEGIINNCAMASMCRNLIASIYLSIDTYEASFHIGSVLNLAATRSGRFGERIFIYYGLDPLP